MSKFNLLPLFLLPSLVNTLALPSQITIPYSSSVVSVQAFDVFASNSSVSASPFMEPILPGRDITAIPAYSFLIEHPSGRRVMFDLGARKDLDGYPPAVQDYIKSFPHINLVIEKDIVEQLTEGGVTLESIDTVIWSHTHLDHTGDMSKWPSSTKLVVGPGSDRRGYPTFPDALLLDSDFAGREVEELAFTESKLEIGGQPALDYLNDGSLYIIDMPGHAAGHIAALVRVKPDSFILLGGDTFHHAGQIRPNSHIQKTYPPTEELVEATRKSVSAEYFAAPGETEFNLTKRETPLLSVPPPPSAYKDREAALESQQVASVLDAHRDILVVAAHDITLSGVIGLFPETLNDWKEKGWKEQSIWAFLDEKNEAFRFSPLPV
ncbi:hypothetical protein AAF712_010644 [Marasmius tenuissimus]|uniref:Metallo-beta-lactamase domain-containing protein n=1 Tax=Marasmius tenuissimus TaxID=585030 RepID=A0ABR2ZMM7_9AGAR